MSLTLAVALAWALVATVPVLSRLCGRFAGWPLALGMLAPLGVLVALRVGGESTLSESVPWIPAIDVALRLRMDGLAFLFVLLILGIGALVLIYSSSYLRAPRSTGFYLLMTAFAAAMLTLVLADDLLVLFIAWELTTLASYLLILRSGPHAGPPATRTLLVTVGGGLALLGAVCLIIARTGTTHLTTALADPVWTDDPTFATVIAILVALAAMTKSAQFPFHAWLPDAMVAPAPVSAYLHAAAMVKAGIFLLMLFAPAASHSPVWGPLLVVIGVLTAVMGAVFATLRTDIKELLAYSTVSQLGLIVAVIGIGTEEAMLAASIHILAHALFKAAAFMGVGLIEKRTGTRDLRELSGLWTVLRWDILMIALAAASMAGVIPLLGFVSKELLLESFLHAQDGLGGGAAVGWVLVLVVAAGAVFTAAYCARMILPVIGGRPMEGVKPWSYAAAMSLPISFTALAGLVLGPMPGVLDGIAVPSAAIAAGAPESEIGYLALWHGITVPLGLSILAVLGGVLLALWLGRRDRADAEAGHAREPYAFPVSGVAVVQGLQDGTIAFGHRVGALTRFDSTAAHLVVPLIAIGAGGLALPVFFWQGIGTQSSAMIVDVVILVVMLAGIVAIARSRTRMGGIISAGVIGFSVVLTYFLLGASDVALTQLLVEILTVVVMILVLRRMSWRFPAEGRRRQVLAAVVAVFAGIAATGATLVFTGHREISGVGEYFLLNAEDLTGGSNIVNTILVDFRAFDTFGELVVLGICAVSLAALLDARTAVNRPRALPVSQALRLPGPNAVYLGSLSRALVPVMVIASAFTLLRGHNDPGGGFIAALLGAAAVVLAYLSARTDDVPGVRKPYLALAGAGMVVAGATGLLGFVEGSYLLPLHADILGYHFTTALIFDLGVYFGVLGVILAAVNRLGVSTTDDGTGRDPRPGDPHDGPEGPARDLETGEIALPIAPAVHQDPDSPLYTGEIESLGADGDDDMFDAPAYAVPAGDGHGRRARRDAHAVDDPDVEGGAR
ncbi:MAG: proton-conducting transporter membrane subunit [Brachybacterium sp.]|nr:proton-conducting transporter membrane subunit [Brachybacterium sp.]